MTTPLTDSGIQSGDQPSATKSIIVLGAGMVGSAMAFDLAKDHRVTLTDLDPEKLKRALAKCPELTVVELDVTREEKLREKIRPFELVVCAVPGFLGYQTLKAIIEAGKDVVDISFFPENALDLDDLARERNVTAIVDCGVAPGMGNIILGHYNERYRVTSFECLVGGLPKKRKWPFAYKAPFSPVDVIEEYTRPARYVENGRLVVREPLSDCETVEFDQVGTLESFNSDGLRSLILTMPHIPDMKEKTLRYPGHVEYIRVLKESGFFGTEKLMAGGSAVIPLEVTSAILFREWYLEEDEEELTVMRITLKGFDHTDKPVSIVYNLYDEYDPVTRISSMARTTGYTATAAANLVLEGRFSAKGISPPERIAKNAGNFEFIISYLKDRNIDYVKSEG
jgi:lysine 6-dehydrogenase